MRVKGRTSPATYLAATHAWLADGIETSLIPALRENDRSLRYLKAICEIAFFIASKPERYPAALLAAVDKCLALVWAKGQLLAMARHNVQHANLFLPLLFACGSRLHLDQRFHDDIRLVARVSLVHTKERIPFRSVDLFHSCWKLTNSGAAHTHMIAAAKNGCLRAGANVASISSDDAYGITHTVFYCTDFGARKWPHGLAAADDVERILVFLAQQPENRENFDLRGEFLLARRYIESKAGNASGEIAAVERARRADGTWAGPVDLQQVLQNENISRAHWSFFSDYHTSLVCAEALAAHRPHAATVGRSPHRTQRLGSRAACTRAHLPRVVASGPTADVACAYRRLGSGMKAVKLSAAALLAPETVVQAVEWHLIRRALLGPATQTASDLSDFTKIDHGRAWRDHRLARVVLAAGAAVSGIRSLRPHRREMTFLLQRLNDRKPWEISIDEACILAMSGAVLNGDELTNAASVLDSVTDWFIGRGDIASAITVASLSALFVNDAMVVRMDELVSSYDAKSMSFGFVVADDERSLLMAERLDLVRLQFRCVRRLTHLRRRPIVSHFAA